MTLFTKDTDRTEVSWTNLQQVSAVTYECGFCEGTVSSKEGYSAINERIRGNPTVIRICPSCLGPTVFTRTGQRFPGSAPGDGVPHVPSDLFTIYNEARQSARAGAYTSAVLVCRKILMNIAVQEGAKEGEHFVTYVEYLSDKGYIPPNGKIWVDYIRSRSNEANHEIALMGEEDAVTLIRFVEMLLRFIYEFPRMVPSDQVTT